MHQDDPLCHTALKAMSGNRSASFAQGVYPARGDKFNVRLLLEEVK